VESTLNGIHGYGSGAEIKEDNLAIWSSMVMFATFLHQETSTFCVLG
jgi:hypothetical protein